MGKRGFSCQYQSNPAGEYTETQNAFARVVFDGYCQQSGANHVISTGLQLLEPLATVETLLGDNPVTRGGKDGLIWAHTDDLLLLAMWASDVGGLEQATRDVYSHLLTEMDCRGYPHMVRVWNYLANINEHVDGQERYRQFCVGRFDAFKHFGVHEKDFPSACALGHFGGDLVVYLLASKKRPVHFENPQQISAYHYPEQYGPRSPSFARATLLELTPDSPTLFLSGTASVIGHVTRHPDDIQGQLNVTLDNIERLLAHVLESRPELKSPSIEVLKVYVRRPDDLALIKAGVVARFGSVPMVFVAADVCRQDLLVEIDGVWQLKC